MEGPQTSPDIDRSLVKNWEANLKQVVPYDMSLAIDGLVVAGTPVTVMNYYQRIGEHQADLSEARGDIDHAQKLRRTSGQRPAKLAQQIEQLDSSTFNYFHLANVEIHGAGNTPLTFPAWRCPRHHVTGWSFGRPDGKSSSPN